MGLFWKVFAGTVAVVAVTAIAVDLLVVGSVRDGLIQEIERRVRSASLLVAAVVERDLADSELDADRLARLGQELPETRITVVAADGRVLFDTHEDPATMDLHGDRPEIRSPGTTVTRFSRTLGAILTYCAARIGTEDEPAGWARVAMRQQDIERQVGEVRSSIRTGVLLAVLAGLLFAAWVSRRVTQPLDEITAVVAELGSGTKSRRLPEGRSDGIGRLAATVNRMAAELEESLERITRDRKERDAILSGMAEGLIAVDRERRVFLLNAAARTLLGFDDGELRDRPIQSVTRIPEVARTVDGCLEQGERVEDEAHLATDGEDRVLHLAAAPFSDDSGVVQGCVLVIHDLTELRRLEKVRRDFVANISHELKTPLTAMRGFVETVHDDPDMDPTVREAFLAKAVAATERLSAIVQDLFSLQRIESERGTLESVPLDLASVAAACVGDARSAAEIKRIELELATPDAPVPVSGDREALAMAIGNLVDNAIRYSPENSHVRVRVGCGDLGAWLEVEDDGPGIPGPEQSRIFERFYRVDKDRSRKLGGTGLGLSIVRNVVVAHGGEVTVDSELGRGSVFRIVLPGASR